MNRSTSVRTLLVAAFSAALLTQLPAHAECFSMYTAKNVLTYESGSSPIDLSRTISGEMAQRFPGRYLVISTTANCGDNTTDNASPTRFDGVGDFSGTSAAASRANPYDAPVPRARATRRR